MSPLDPKFARYLLNELLWELDQARVHVPELTSVDMDEVEVLSYSGYDSLRFRIAATVLEARLSWRPDVPPTVTRLPEESS